ncbi:phage tail tape measure protein [Hymenobacter sp. B81]|uniref:phage tail tape measure protein n=1 Tax=Hymenobacter sp. B81 TaxID=3344878 RepID=UPI0037DCD530
MKNYQWIINLVDKASAPMQSILQKGERMSGVFNKAQASTKQLFYGLGVAAQVATGFQSANDAINRAVEPGIRFEQTLAEVSAITGVTGKGLQEMGESGRQMASIFGGPVTGYLNSTKSILSELGPQMAKDQAAMDSMNTSVAILSKSMGGDAEGATKALTTSLQQFNVDLKNPQTSAKAMTMAMNVMAAAANAGAAEVPQISDALKVAGVAASGARVGFIETNAAIQVLAQGGMKGAEAGTALRNVISKLGEGRFLPKDVQTELKAAGVNINVLTDKSLSLGQRLTELKKIQGDSALVSKLFGMENQNAAGILLRGTEAMASYEKQITGTNAAVDAAKTIMDTTAGRMERAKAMWENMGISVFNATKPYLPYIQTAGQAGVMVSQMIPLFMMLGNGLTVAGGKMWAFTMSTAASGLALGKQAAVMVLSGLTAVGSFVVGLISATAAQWGLNVAMNANPIGLIIVGLVAVGAAVYMIIRHWDTLKVWLLEMGKWMLKMNPFYIMVQGIFQLFPGIEKWFSQLWDKVTGFVKSLVGKFKGIWDAIAPYLGLGTMQITSIDDKLLKPDAGGVDPFAAGQNAQALSLGGSKGVKAKADKVSSGGSKPTTVNITIGKFQDSINIHATTLKEGTNDMVAMLEEALTRVVNGVSQGVGTT